MTVRRIAVLLLCLAAGALIGAAVRAWTGSDAGFLAIPALLALAWLAVARPDRCEPPRR